MSQKFFRYYKKMRELGLAPGYANAVATQLVQYSGGGYKIFAMSPADRSPRGGLTYVSIWSDDDKFLARGVATCSPEDPYCKRTGIKLALKRAIVASDLTVDEWTPLAEVYGVEYVAEVFAAILGGEK